MPELTEQVMELFQDDSEANQNFVCGSGRRTYTGDIAGEHDREAKVATAFLSHHLAAIWEWARLEKSIAEKQASRHREDVAEHLVPA